MVDPQGRIQGRGGSARCGEARIRRGNRNQGAGRIHLTWTDRAAGQESNYRVGVRRQLLTPGDTKQHVFNGVAPEVGLQAGISRSGSCRLVCRGGRPNAYLEGTDRTLGSTYRSPPINSRHREQLREILAFLFSTNWSSISKRSPRTSKSTNPSGFCVLPGLLVTDLEKVVPEVTCHCIRIVVPLENS